ncbi:hypothetical protein QLS71_010595 [Mariniflexile litorale]|uniref:DUF4374 domain-containing protein n=1 Tax=Mariniflexile litorale TaxID=3045158 RepID=A0AAU7EAX0_9FLAO|nr:hypothetical protein [Mariniflexile sp. KMM 9835]MDQ8212509.1 hypothetical protein [Mariniflexile sp. KMM 9835]
MKNRFLNIRILALAVSSILLTVSCTKDNADAPTETKEENSRWITVTGARMGTNAGDGNGGTLIYAISSDDAKNPETVVDVFNYGFVAPSNRTARLQSSEDGNTMFNISYAGDTGGNYTKYTVNGGQEFTPTGSEVSIAPYVGTAPRWIKLFDGDQTGAAVYVSTEHEVDDNGTPDIVTDDTYIRTNAKVGVVTLDLVDSKILNFKELDVALSAEEEANGYYFSRVDMPVLNAAGNKLYIGGRLSKVNPATVESDSDYEILGSKTIVLDYPTLFNPKVITSTVGYGNTNGYRSINAFLSEDGNVYQANQGDPNGSHILRIGANNEYDNSYVFSLNNALGVEEAYIVAWRYAGNGKAVVAYEHAGSATGPAGKTQGFFALIDLNAKTATKLDAIPSSEDLYLYQYQGFAVNGTEVYLTVAPIGQDGNIYIVDTETGDVTKGAQLINVEGSHFIGTF